jgi:uncharacterized protein (DUF1684 family)
MFDKIKNSGSRPVKWVGITLLFEIMILIAWVCGKPSDENKPANDSTSVNIIQNNPELYTPEQKTYVDSVLALRAQKDAEFQNDPSSPFNSKTKIEFHPLKYYQVDPNFVFYSKLTEYPKKDTVIIYGTKGEPRKTVRFGYVTINYNGKPVNLNVYKALSTSGSVYYSIWFTDETTNFETYGVGRYLEFDYNPNPNHVYTIDFNLAFNPYCAYSPEYSCAIPTKEDHIPIPIKAGEKKWHE